MDLFCTGKFALQGLFLRWEICKENFQHWEICKENF